MRTIVLDTNCLLTVLPSISPYHNVWTGILDGSIALCVSNDIMEEYEEILGEKTTPQIASLVVRSILDAPALIKVTPTYFYNLITVDPDDNKFVDCAICAGAELLVSNDGHFKVLRKIDFPKVEVMRLQDFSALIESKR